jgi:hypothetical protein
MRQIENESANGQHEPANGHDGFWIIFYARIREISG